MTNNNQEIVSAQDHGLFHEIAKEVRNNPAKYNEPGKWLDEYCSEGAYWHRQQNELKRLQAEEKKFPTLPIVKELRQLEEEIRIKRTPALIIRFQEARNYLLEKYEDQQFIPQDDAKKIVVLTWLLTDPDAEKSNLEVTELERWPWEPTDDITKMSRGAAQSLWVQSEVGYERWMKLVRISWGKIQEHKKERWYKSATFRYVIVPLVVALLTSPLWTPIIKRIRGNPDEIKEASVEKKILLSLKEICRDIDSRPLLQREETAKQYVSMLIEKEPLELFEVIPYDESGEFNLILLLPGEPYQVGPTGWKISATVDKGSYPWLGTAKRGLRLKVSGRIEQASTTVIGLCDVSLEIDTRP